MQESLTLLSASIPTVFIAWFVIAIAQRIYTRCRQMARRQLAQVEAAIATAAPIPPKALAIEPFVTPQPKPLVPAQTPLIGTLPYQSMSLTGIEPRYV